MRIEILGDDCSKCRRLYDNVQQAVAESGTAVKISRTNDPDTLARYGVRSLPGLVVDGTLLATGKILSTAEVRAMLERDVS
jgi:small redox-active disulfide protein 2